MKDRPLTLLILLMVGLTAIYVHRRSQESAQKPQPKQQA